MIDATRPPPEGRQIVQRYGDGGFTVSGVVLRGPILILPDRTLPWTATRPDEVSAAGLAALRSAEPAVELLIVGMGTPAACRTYNVLATEGRRVAAALIPV